MNKKTLLYIAVAGLAFWFLKKKGLIPGLKGLGVACPGNPYAPRSPEWTHWAEQNQCGSGGGGSIVEISSGASEPRGGYGGQQEACAEGFGWKPKLHYDRAQHMWTNCWKLPKPKVVRPKKVRGSLLGLECDCND